nr:sulfite exporter TauE/SafE family protein [Halalkalibacterium ligniniphilum]
MEYGYNLPIALTVAFVVGFLAGLFGIGGGALLIPVMVLLFQFPPRTAVATSMLVIFFSAITGSFTHLALGNIEWTYAICLTIGAWFGAKIGAAFNQRLKSEVIMFVFRIVLIGVGVRLIIDGFKSISFG